ncbi:MAG TPA: serine hydroxymethyltransferase [Bacilli bacterium]|nr:serine hydroxymethyltransferase [Bacilli bacterium]HOH18045.1 serine hydroxymethyltransferase [Bacilli bacterium]HPX84171.1 serine hydroxymethyltransferase [Bacilli bacterium]HQC74237.1 serine hydroxymethyltransferase [Bacilli bacterium]
MMSLKKSDPEIYQVIQKETRRQQNNIELIASENFVSKAVLEAQGSILTNKYAEGYPNKRYYGGCVHVDVLENLAIERAKKLFDANFANVQAHSGSTANMAAYRALIKPGDRVLGMALDQGGHLTHGHPLSFSGIDYQFFAYHVDRETGLIDYEEVEQLAKEIKPALIVAGASAYSRIIDFKRFRSICDTVKAKLMVDMAHIAGLVAAKLHPNPVLYADVVTTTTHKTLRGPRGGLILTNDEEIAKTINKVVFPGIQGGPLMHIIAAKAVCFAEALKPDFIDYQKQVIANAQALSQELQMLGYTLVAKGTDNHLVIVDVKKSLGITGKMAEEILDEVAITCNKNTVPFDSEKPMITSGIRLGSPSVTTRGFKENEMRLVARLIDQALRHRKQAEELEKVKAQVLALTKQYPIYQ